MAVFAGHPSTSSNTCLNFSKNCDFSNFLQFLEKSQKLQKLQFLLGILLPPLTLDLINFSKNCDFSNFSQVLLLHANLDISCCSAFFSHTCTCKSQEYSKGLDYWLGPVLVFFRVWFEYLILGPKFQEMGSCPENVYIILSTMLGKGKHVDLTQCKSLYTPNVGVTWWQECEKSPEEQAELTDKNTLHSYLPKRSCCGVYKVNAQSSVS